mmetsp:Transcript_14109/g.23445  ORF Transcript_14109/g.23445 Transcript_14109/m.23445 type:complete len:200 (+) Transcript_14109:738-1337(+)
MNRTLNTMHRCTATCGARVSRLAHPSIRRLPKPSSDEKNLHVVIQSILAPLYPATVPSHFPSAVAKVCAAGFAPGSENHVLHCLSAGSCSLTIARRSSSMICQSDSYTGRFFQQRYRPTRPLTQPARAPIPVPALTPEPWPMYVSFSLPSVIELMSIAYFSSASALAMSSSARATILGADARARVSGVTRYVSTTANIM